MSQTKSFIDFIQALNSLSLDNRQTEQEIMAQVAPIVKAFGQQTDWLEERFYQDIDTTEGSSKHCLYAAPDHNVAVFLTAWLPQRDSLPHNHGTWAVLTSLTGTEKHTLWARIDDGNTPGYAELVAGEHIDCTPGSVVCLGSNQIHSVENASDNVLLTLQVYGKNLNATQRSRFNPKDKTETIIKPKE